MQINEMALLVGRSLVYSLWQGTLVLFCYLAARRLLLRCGARARHGAAATALLLLTVLPVVTLVLSQAGAALLGQSAAGEGSSADAPRWLHQLDPWLSSPALLAIVAVWLTGALFGLARLGVGVYQLQRLVAGARPGQVRDAAALARRAGLGWVPRVVETPGATSPAVVGWRRPVLLLPERFDAGLVRAEVEAVLLHELAHLRRRDFLRNLLERVAGALAWHQPGTRVLLADLRREREHCCDELAVAAIGSPVELARALVALEARRAGLPRLALAGTGGDLRQRIERILARPDRRDRARGLRPLWAGGLLLGSACLAAFAAGGAEASRLATLHSYIVAHDPAGRFTVALTGDRLVGATIDGHPVPPERIVQRGRRVDLLDVTGRPTLSLRVRPGGIRWEPRSPLSP